MKEACQAVVIGAGPAGSLTASLLASSGVQTVLVEKARFPRDKVCGGCLNRVGLSVLDRHGLGDLPWRAGGRPVHTFDLSAFGRRASFPMVPGIAVSRRELDAALARRAVEAGVEFREGTTAIVGHVEGRGRRVTLRCGERESELVAGIAVVSDGIGGSAVREDSPRWRPLSPGARVGLATLAPGPTGRIAKWSVAMAVARHGYLGIVEVENGTLDIAAAVDQDWLRAQESPYAGLTSLLEQSGLTIPGGLPESGWAGTVPLTRTPIRRAEERLFLVGDAAGYVEPFTGEGMGNALAGAELLAPIVMESVRHWEPRHAERWERASRRLLSASYRRCRWISSALRRPLLMGGATALLGWSPSLAAPLFRRIQQPPDAGRFGSER